MPDLPKVMLPWKQEVTDISEKVRDRAKRTKILKKIFMPDLHKVMWPWKQEVTNITETVRDRAKRTKICDPQGNIQVLYCDFDKIFQTWPSQGHVTLKTGSDRYLGNGKRKSETDENLWPVG